MKVNWVKINKILKKCIFLPLFLPKIPEKIGKDWDNWDIGTVGDIGTLGDKKTQYRKKTWSTSFTNTILLTLPKKRAFPSSVFTFSKTTLIDSAAIFRNQSTWT